MGLPRVERWGSRKTATMSWSFLLREQNCAKREANFFDYGERFALEREAFRREKSLRDPCSLKVCLVERKIWQMLSLCRVPM